MSSRNLLVSLRSLQSFNFTIKEAVESSETGELRYLKGAGGSFKFWWWRHGELQNARRPASSRADENTQLLACDLEYKLKRRVQLTDNSKAKKRKQKVQKTHSGMRNVERRPRSARAPKFRCSRMPLKRLGLNGPVHRIGQRMLGAHRQLFSAASIAKPS